MRNFQNLVLLFAVFQCLSINGTIKLKIGIDVAFDPQRELTSVDFIKAALVRAHYFNQIEDFIHPNASIEIIYGTSVSSKSSTIENAIVLGKEGILSAVIRRISSLTELSSLILQSYNVPLCAGSATSPSLSNPRIYPNFFRAIPNDAAQAESMAGYLLSQGWRKVAIVYTTESYGENLATFFSNAARSRNLTILSSQAVFIGSSQEKLFNTVSNLKESGAKIFVYFGRIDEYSLVVAEAKKVGIYGEGYNWIGGDALAHLVFGQFDRTLFTGTSYFFPIEGIF
jgi:ABC-type branched-subunit amino acid transport system substrate-binding protein